MALRVGCRVWVKTAIFDQNEGNRWSTTQFGDEWDHVYEVEAVRMVYKMKVRVRFAFDRTSYTFEHDPHTHDAVTCPVCASERQ